MEFKLKQNRVYEELREGILSGKYPHLGKLPAEAVFCREFEVSRITLRHALKRLEAEKLVKRMRPQGTFAIHPGADILKKIVVLHPSITDTNHHVIDILSGIESVAEYYKSEIIRLDVSSFFTKLKQGSILFESFREDVFGIIALINSFNKDDPALFLLKKLNLPVIIPWAAPLDQKTTGFAVISPQLAQGWTEAVNHLLAMGHRTIATVVTDKPKFRGMSPDDHFQLLADNGASTSPHLLKQVKPDEDNVFTAVSSLMSSPEPPTVIMCYSDAIASYVYSALEKLDLKIPDDVAVMGFGGLAEGAFFHPSLSTMSCGYPICGKLSLKLLMQSDEWYGKENVAPPLIRRGYDLIQRKSTDLKRIEYQFER